MTATGPNVLKFGMHLETKELNRFICARSFIAHKASYRFIIRWYIMMVRFLITVIFIQIRMSLKGALSCILILIIDMISGWPVTYFCWKPSLAASFSFLLLLMYIYLLIYHQYGFKWCYCFHPNNGVDSAVIDALYVVLEGAMLLTGWLRRSVAGVWPFPCRRHHVRGVWWYGWVRP